MADNFQSLAAWVGKTGNAELSLQQITGQLTVASANLGTDVENLAQAVGQNLTQAMQGAIFQATGGQKAFDDFATAVINSHGNVNDLKSSATQLATSLLEVEGNTSAAHNEFDTLAIGLHLGKAEADQLWASVLKLAETEAGTAAPSTHTLAGELQQIITNAGGASTNVGKLKTALLGNVDEIIASGATRQQLIKDLENAGLSAKTATTLVDDLETAISKLTNKTVTITTDMITTGQTPITGINPSASGAAPAKKAAGGQVRGGSGRPRADDIPSLLSDREWVIQTPAVDKYGPQLFENLNAMRYADGGQALAGARRSSGGSGMEAPGAPVINNNSFNYYGPQHPTPEMQQAMIMNLTSAVGLAG